MRRNHTKTNLQISANTTRLLSLNVNPNGHIRAAALSGRYDTGFAVFLELVQPALVKAPG